MKKLSIHIMGISSTLLLLSANSNALPNSGAPTTFLGTIARVGVDNAISNTSAFSVAAEASPNNFRLNGSFGWILKEDQKLKLSAEYLLQNIAYSYFSGNTRQWVQQGDLSADYRYALGEYTYLYNPQFDMTAYVSHSPGKSLRADSGFFVNKAGVINEFVDNKRIAGSSAGGISPGFMLSPWVGGNVGVYLNYDNVNYDTDYISSQNAKGFGGSAHLNQIIDNNIEAGVSLGVRKPFDNYNAHITWLNLPFYGLWSVGVNGAYTSGKNRLPDTYSVGISVDFLVNQGCLSSETQKEDTLRFLNWVSKPAVYMPQVLAIPDERVTLTPVVPF